MPVNRVESFRNEVRLTLGASELAGLDLFDMMSLRPMPDQWKMPAGFDLRSFFLVPGDGWTEAVLPFVLTSPAASGTPDYFRDPNAPGGARQVRSAADSMELPLTARCRCSDRPPTIRCHSGPKGRPLDH